MSGPSPSTLVAGSRRGGRLSVYVPDVQHERRSAMTPTDNELEVVQPQEEALTQSLSQNWEAAKARFKKATNQDLGDDKSTKDGILGTLRQKYGSDSKEAQKHDKFFGTLESILNGVELVAATAMQAASQVFAPAEMCFNAFSILLNIPRAIKKFGDDLQVMFQEVSSYLNSFRIYDRIDRRGTLDPTLLISNNQILISLVDLCMLAYKVIHNPIRTLLGNIFLKNDEISAALVGFRSLIDHQNQLTSTVTLETVLKSQTLNQQIKQQTARIEATEKDTNTVVRGMAAENAENKNLKVDRDRILRIISILDLNENIVNEPLERLRSIKSSLPGETAALVKNHKVIRAWRECADARRLLYIRGDTGTGKTNVLGALEQDINEEKKKLQTQRREGLKDTQNRRDVYLIYYSFNTDGQAKDRGKIEALAYTAFKIMAVQLARQSTSYARELSEAVENIQKGQKTLRELWNALKISTFSAPADSVLYVFFDGVDQLRSNLRELGSILMTGKASTDVKDKPLLKLALTGKVEASKELAVGNFPTINMSEINESLIEKFVARQLQILSLFQDDDKDSKERKKTVLEIITKNCHGSFGVAAQKIKILEKAVNEDADFEVLTSELQLETLNTVADEGRTILARLGESMELSVQHKQQLKELLTWAVYAKERPGLEELEAALYLQQNKKSLEPLRSKVEQRFAEALEINDYVIYPRVEIEEAIKSYVPASNTDAIEDAQALVKLIGENVSDSAVREIVRNLSNKLSKIMFETSSQTEQIKALEGSTESSGRECFLFAQGEAEFTVVNRLLRALNDDKVRHRARALIKYATVSLPSHLNSFRVHSLLTVTPEELGTVGRALINFLCDSDSIAAAWDVQAFNGPEWFDDVNVDAIRDILTHHSLIDQLDPLQRRWISKNTAGSNGGIAFLDSIARTVARKWLHDRSFHVRAVKCFWFIDDYIDLLIRRDPLALKPARASSNVGEERVENDQDLDTVLSNEEVSERTVDVTTENLYQDEHDDATEEQFRSETMSDGTLTHVDTHSSVVANEEETSQVSEHGADEPRIGNFSASSEAIALIQESRLVAYCYDLEGSLESTSIDLNEYLANNSGTLRWQQGGNAFATARYSRLSQGGKVLEVELKDEAGEWQLQSIGLDERISNQDGQLVFLQDEDLYPSNDAANMASSDDTELTNVRRVERAKDWAVGILGMEMNSLALTRIGHTLLGFDADMAIQYLNKVESDSQEPWKAVGMCLAYEHKKEYDKALASLQDSLAIFRAKEKGTATATTFEDEKFGGEEDQEVTDLFTCLRRVARYQSILDNDSAAIDALEEALTRRRIAGPCRLQLMELLCKNDRHSRAEELLDDWMNDYLKPGAESLASFLNAISTLDLFYENFWPIVIANKSPRLSGGIQKLFEVALEEAKVKQRDTDSIGLLHGQGVTLAFGKDVQDANDACESWIEALRIGQTFRVSPDDERPQAEILIKCSEMAGLHYFERARANLKFLPKDAHSEKSALVEQLQNETTKLLGPHTQGYRRRHAPTLYAVSLASLADQLDYVKEALRSDMVEALDILTDRDIYNDDTGIIELVRVLIRSGDIEGALSAWSLLDRVVNRPRLQKRLASATSVGKDPGPPATDHLESEDGEDQILSSREDDDDDDTSTTSEATEETDTVDKYCVIYCDFCYQDIQSWEHENWWCRYCPYVNFCTGCKGLLKQGHMTRYICHPDHDLVLIKHAEYSKEELRGTNVLIEWKCNDVQQEDGSIKRERIGGRIVELKEWIDLLKQEWKITDSPLAQPEQ